MEDANYQEHCKVLGKLCYLYDQAAAEEAATRLVISVFVDQYAAGDEPTYETVVLLCPFIAGLDSAVDNGAEVIQSRARTIATAYLTSSIFYGDLTTTPANLNSAASVLTALQTEMGAGEDDKTFGTLAGTGFVHFFNLWSPTGAWNTEADATADYRDAIFVVGTIV